MAKKRTTPRFKSSQNRRQLANRMSELRRVPTNWSIAYAATNAPALTPATKIKKGKKTRKPKK